ncbi:hypothetical protein SynBIOSE41_00991 [Synechococcus sp. BIOS-E4-1]|nr:hypothetical protein SynBIOSE41_00991 [Synechococcus sp. BIOS-E4-1]
MQRVNTALDISAKFSAITAIWPMHRDMPASRSGKDYSSGAVASQASA